MGPFSTCAAKSARPAATSACVAGRPDTYSVGRGGHDERPLAVGAGLDEVEPEQAVIMKSDPARAAMPRGERVILPSVQRTAALQRPHQERKRLQGAAGGYRCRRANPWYITTGETEEVQVTETCCRLPPTACWAASVSTPKRFDRGLPARRFQKERPRKSARVLGIPMG